MREGRSVGSAPLSLAARAAGERRKGLGVKANYEATSVLTCAERAWALALVTSVPFASSPGRRGRGDAGGDVTAGREERVELSTTHKVVGEVARANIRGHFTRDPRKAALHSGKDGRARKVLGSFSLPSTRELVHTYVCPS